MLCTRHYGHCNLAPPLFTTDATRFPQRGPQDRIVASNQLNQLPIGSGQP